MAIDNTVDLPTDELKVIIHALRMSNLAFVEDNAIDEIRAMIKALPLPEQIDQLTVNHPMSIKNLQKDIGNIMRLIELYGKRDVEFKTRYKSRTGLPPRYKVLDWRSKMKDEVKASVREIVKLSADLDGKGYGEISSSLNKFASKIVQDQFDESELDKIAAAFQKEGLEKEAQWLQKMKGFMGGAMGKVKEMATDIWQAGQAGGLEAEYNALYNQMVKFKGKVDALATGAQDSNIRQQMAALSKLIDVSGKQMNEGVKKAKQGTKKPQKPPAGAPRGQVSEQKKAPGAAQPAAAQAGGWEESAKAAGWTPPAAPAAAPAAAPTAGAGG